MIILSSFPVISPPLDFHLSRRRRLSQGVYLPIPYPLSLSSSPSPKFASNPPTGLRAHRYFTNKPYIVASIPARDRVIEFGKYRGKMLGSLPSRYLQWISKNLRARDFEEWSKLAGESHCHRHPFRFCLLSRNLKITVDAWLLCDGFA